MKNVHNCTLTFTAITASAHINNVEDSKLKMASHQIRIHHTKRTKFYLLARSNPIIEHSTELSFGDLTKTEMASEDGVKETWESCGLDKKNMFDQVHDFQWLKQEQSPNWKVIDS